MNIVNPSSVRYLLRIAIVGLLSLPATARRRDPVSELERFSNGRRLTQQEDGQGLITKDSVRGSRSLVGINANVPVPSGPDDHLVNDLPLLNKDDFPGAHWAGLLPVNDKKDGYLFYWLFAPDKDALAEAKQTGMVNEDESNVPLLIWLNGGPACSSMDGLWIENGPFRLNPSKNGNWNNIRIDPTSWHKAPAYTLYIDQPVGTGLSFTTSENYPSNDRRVNEDFYYFLNEFMKLHKDTLGIVKEDKGWTLQRPFFFSGESHAGHYIPSMMNYIRKKNLELANHPNQDSVIMPLSGAAIGNGWFDPIYQYSAHEAAYGYSLIGKAQARSLAQKEERCREDLRQQKYTSNICFGLLGDVTDHSLGRRNPQTISQYDARVFENRQGQRDFPAGHKDVEAFLGQTRKIPNASIHNVLKALHATPSWESGQRYLECTDAPYYALSHQDGLGVVPDIVELLENEETNGDGQAQIRLLFFNGIHDLICNHVGNENALESLPWKHKDDFIQAERYGWVAPSINSLGGYGKEFENLSFLKVLDAGHMVPMDVPEVALDMMKAFLYPTYFSKNNKKNKKLTGPFSTYAQELPLSLEQADPSCQACPDCPQQGEECPICRDDNDDDDTDTECPEKCESTDAQPLGILSSSSSPLIMGVVAGTITFLVLVIVTRCCFNLGSSTAKYHKAGQIELADSHNGGGYRDEDLDGEYGVDSFEDE